MFTKIKDFWQKIKDTKGKQLVFYSMIFVFSVILIRMIGITGFWWGFFTGAIFVFLLSLFLMSDKNN